MPKGARLLLALYSQRYNRASLVKITVTSHVMTGLVVTWYTSWYRIGPQNAEPLHG